MLGFGSPPASKHDRKDDRANRNSDTGQDVPYHVEPFASRRHQYPFPIYAFERLENLRSRITALHQRDDVAVHRRRHLATEIRRATGVDVQRTAALAPEAMLEGIAFIVRDRRRRTGLGGHADGASGAL